MSRYGYKMSQVNTLHEIESTGWYCYKELNFLYKKSKSAKNLVVVFHGYVPGKGRNRITFRGYDYEIENSDIICICDYLLTKYDDYNINWTLETNKYQSDKIYIEVFKYFNSKYQNIYFTGTSAGGYPALKFASETRQNCIISNCQLYLEEYGKNKNYGIEHLEKVLLNNNDALIYNDRFIEKIVSKNNPKRIILFSNVFDETFHKHIYPFIKYMNVQGLFHLIDLNLFAYNSLDIPQAKTQHHIQFPDNESHLEILRRFIN